MNLNALQTFLLVAEELNFGRAAERLALTQPAVTAQIHQLERELGVRLLERWGRRTELTEPGQLLFAYAQRISVLSEEASEALRDYNGRPQGRVRVSGTASLVLALLPGPIRRFQQAYPEVTIDLRTASTEEVVTGVTNGTFDAGVAYLTHEAPELEHDVLCRDYYILLAPFDHSFARQGIIDVQALDNLPMLFLSPGTAGRPLLDRRLGELNVHPRVYLELNSSMAIKKMVAAGVGVGVVSYLAVKDEISDGIVQVVKVRHLSLEHDVVVMYHRTRYRSLAAREFVAALRSIAPPPLDPRFLG